MQILVDENIPLTSVKKLQELGHHIIDIRGTSQEGVDDEMIWEIVQENSALLVSTDKGFTKDRNKNHYGILIIRLKQPNGRKIHERIINIITNFPEDKWENTLIVVRDEVKSVWSKG
jgi:predicted nuclease of predicted toxin-antitoxin system